MRAAAPVGVVHDEVRGRLRLSAPALRDRPKRARQVEAALSGLPGVRAVSVRPLTGSIVLRLAEGCEREAVREAAAKAVKGASFGGDVAPPGEGAAAQAWHAASTRAVAEAFASDPDCGLTRPEAAARLARHGPNRAHRSEKEGVLPRIARQFDSVPVMMLGASAAASILTGGATDAAATLAVIVINGTIGFVTEGQAEHTIGALMDTSARTVVVVRDGAPVSIPAVDVVPGDVLRLVPGQEVAADGRIVAGEDLYVDESPLTGESLPVAKDATAAVSADAPIGERPTMAFAATLVAEGHGQLLVTATGGATEAARIEALSAGASRPTARVEEELDRLGGQLAGACLGACGLFLALGWLRGYPLPVIFKDALALAVAAVPEGLPAVATSTLALGIRALKDRGILVRKLSAVEQLGAVGVVCLDKTGTLTQNRMEVVETVAGLSERTGPGIAAIAEAAALNTDGGDPAAPPSATEQALAGMAARSGVDAVALATRRPCTLRLPRRPGRPMLATVHGGADPIVVVKGAPEALLARCDRILEGGTVRPLTDHDRERLADLNDRLAARPARVIAFARRGEAVPQETIGEEDVRDLVWVGLAAMVDPVRPEAPGFVASLRRAGIRPVLVTGDQAATAGAIAREIGLAGERPLRIVDAPEMADLAPPLVAELARQADVFSRVSSDQKLSVVRALQAGGAVVAMTGDGVNDGPALRAADVGIAMGVAGADLARDAANVVIRHDDLAALVDAIGRGRSIFRNIRRAVDFLVATNMSEILVSIAEAVHGPGETETPMELLWINLVTDVFPGLGLALAEPDPDAMERPPRDPDAPFIREEDVSRIALDGSVIALAALAAHGVGLARHGPGPATRGMTFLSLSVGQLVYALTCQRTDVRRLEIRRLFSNPTLDAALAGSLVLAVAPFLVRPLGRLLGVAPLGRNDLAVSIGAALAPIGFVFARRAVLRALDGTEAVR